MKLVHVVPHIDQEAAGPSYSVPRLCQSLAACGIDVHKQWPILKRFAISSSFTRALIRKAQAVDVVHNHSLWSMVNVAAGWVVPGRHAKLVTSPRGTLSAYAMGRSRWLKRLLWPLQRRALAKADMLHATSESELQEIRALGLKAPVVLLPNGIDLPDLPRVEVAQESDTRTLLYLGRIHPIKGLDRLLQAWAQVQAKHPQWRLLIAGRGETIHEKAVKAMALSLALQRVEFIGPMYSSAKAAAYFSADLFVLPTHSENFGMVVAEALVHGCPAVVSRGAPWAGLESENCGWWVDNSVASLSVALDVAMQLPSDQLVAMGLRGRAWMERDFGWAAIGQKMDATYRWLLNGGERPAWIWGVDD
jgi:glycosyltransferase involved in cell wall biosynthesis